MTPESSLEGELAGVARSITARTLVHAEGLVELAGEQLEDLAELADDAALALAGDARARAHLEAQLALQQFSASARAYLEAAQFRRALAAALVEVAGVVALEGAKLVAKSLAGALLQGVES